MYISKAQRAACRAILAKSTEYDPDSIIIHRDGTVTAIKDPNKTFIGYKNRRFEVGYVGDMVTNDGLIKERWLS